jgi:hypothetical protein
MSERTPPESNATKLDIGDKVEIVAYKVSMNFGMHHLDGERGVIIALGQGKSVKTWQVKLVPSRPDGKSGNVYPPEAALRKIE